MKKAEKNPNPPDTKESLEKLISLRMAELIERGALLKPGVEVLLNQVRKEFEERARSKLSLNAEALKLMLLKTIWSGEPGQKSKQAIKAGLFAKDFQEFYPNIPLAIVEQRFEYLRGTTNKKYPPEFLSGLGHFDPAKEKEMLRLPEGSFKNPVKLPGGALEGLEFFNGPAFGTAYNPVIEENPLRCALSGAEKRGTKVLVLTNVMDIRVKKTASSNMIDLAEISGHLLDEDSIKLLDPDYQEEALEALQEIRKDPTTDRMIYVKPTDLVKLTFKGLYKASNKTDEKTGKRAPEFSGKILLVLGHIDEEIVSNIAGTRAAENTIRAHGRARMLLEMAERALAALMKDEGATMEKMEVLEKKIDNLRAEVEYTKVSHSAKNNASRYKDQALSLLIRGYQAAIPNCTVIGKGTTYVEVDGKIVEINIPGDARATATGLEKYNASYGPKTLRGQFADAVVICPPYSINYNQTDREHSGEGSRKTSPVFTTPMLIDEKFLREHTKDIIRTSVHKLLPVIRNELTCTGFLRLDFCGEKREIISPSTFPMDFTIASANRKLKLPGKAPAYITSKWCGEEPYLCVYVATDPHRGGRARELIWSPEKRKYLGVHEATLELMERDGLYKDPTFPIPTFSFVCDDIVQGLHFPAHSQTHPHLISQGDMEKLYAEEIGRVKASGDKNRMATLMEDMHKELSYQRRIQGTDWVEDQLTEAEEEMLDPYGKFYALMLSNAVDARVELTGMSKYQPDARKDDRDLGLINYTISGNHMERTVDGHVAEGRRMARSVRFLVRHEDRSRWEKNPEALKNMVRAVNFSGQGIGGATVRIPGGKPWGLMARDSGTTISNWGNPLGASARKELQRGDHLGFQKFVESTLIVLGNWHFGTSVETPSIKWEMGPAGTHTDRYGQRGFPPNNTGVKFVLIPANGPNRGPVIRRTLMSWNLRYYMENPKAKLDWKKFLPNVIRAS